LLLVGDFNTTEREVAYAELARGLTDAHRAVGWGTGHSWRLRPTWPLGLIRIDYQWGSPRVTPMRLNTDCTPHGSDHCMLTGTFAVQ
jgi:endonuclease/exonuclease/phosphatase (EEP) superfamily protein YafD